MTWTQTLASQVQSGWYDAVVRIDHFTDVYDWSKGWKVGLAANCDKVLEKGTAVRVAPIGVSSVGKTWLLKKLCGEPGDSGLLSHTEGLGIKVSQLPGETDRLTCFLDTAGTMTSPVTSLHSLKQMLDVSKSDRVTVMDTMLQEMKRQENLIRHVALEFAQVFLVVVGQILHRDLLELLQLIELAQNQAKGTKKQIIVVHNLKTMSHAAFAEDVPAHGNRPAIPSYLTSVRHRVGLAARKVMVAPEQYIDELFGCFGDVQVRHVFLTREDHPPMQDLECKNEAVIHYIRTLIQAVTPTTGNALEDIAKIATDCAKTMVRLPPSKNIEIRFHKGRGVLLGGEVEEAEAKQLAAWAKRPPKSEAVAQAEATVAEYKLRAESGLLTDAEREQMDAADAHLSDAVTQTKSNGIAPARNAETLLPLRLNVQKGAFEMPSRPVATVVSGDRHVKYNVSRLRAMVGGHPLWMVFVHFSIPGLAPGELVKLRNTLRWDEGVTMEPEAPQEMDTLKLHFTVTIVNSPAKQLEALNRDGAAVRIQDKRTLGGAIRIDANAERSIVEVGNRPFVDGTDRVELEVCVHTKVKHCCWDLEPVLSYGRGVLTVMVCAEPSDNERAAPENQAWIEEGCEALDFAMYVPNADGSDDDVEDVQKESSLSIGL